MAQSTVLAAGSAAGSSSTIVVAAGAKVTVGLFTAAGAVPANAVFNVVQKTPGADMPLSMGISAGSPRLVLDAPGSYAVNRVNGGSTVAPGGIGPGQRAYKVTGVNATGESLPSNEIVVTTMERNNTVTLAWAAMANAVSYKLYEGGYAGGESQVIALGNVLTYNDTGAGWSAGTPPTVDHSGGATPPVQAAATIASPGITTPGSVGVFTES